MVERFTHKVGKHELSVVFDKDELKKQIESEMDNFREGYVPNGFFPEEGYLDKETYQKNIKDMLSVLEKITAESKLIEFIEKARKKKNGTFYKKGICYRKGCENSWYICEWHNTWIYMALVVSAISDTTLLMSYKEIVDTPA